MKDFIKAPSNYYSAGPAGNDRSGFLSFRMDFGKKALKFYRNLRIDEALPDGVEVMNPYQRKMAFEVCRRFYEMFYNDDLKRYLILGINPGRNGAGITGIPFTDPVKLEQRFRISNDFQKKTELSADFIYTMIDAFGGAEKFFRKFFINSISPLGFIRGGKNVNYYDFPALRDALGPFIRKSMKSMLELNVHRSVAFCLGEGANFKYLQALNREMGYFEQIIPLAHPRFIMQYRRKRLPLYVEDYLQKLNGAR